LKLNIGGIDALKFLKL